MREASSSKLISCKLVPGFGSFFGVDLVRTHPNPKTEWSSRSSVFSFYQFYAHLEADAQYCCTTCSFNSIHQKVYRVGEQAKFNSRSTHMVVSASSCTPLRTPRSSSSTAISYFCYLQSVSLWNATIAVHCSYQLKSCPDVRSLNLFSTPLQEVPT